MDTAGLPEMDGVAAGHPGSLELQPGRGPEPGRREARSSDTAAAAAAVVGQAEGLQAECCILQREQGSEGVSLIHCRVENKKSYFTTQQLLFYF